MSFFVDGAPDSQLDGVPQRGTKFGHFKFLSITGSDRCYDSEVIIHFFGFKSKEKKKNAQKKSAAAKGKGPSKGKAGQGEEDAENDEKEDTEKLSTGEIEEEAADEEVRAITSRNENASEIEEEGLHREKESHSSQVENGSHQYSEETFEPEVEEEGRGEEGQGNRPRARMGRGRSKEKRAARGRSKSGRRGRLEIASKHRRGKMKEQKKLHEVVVRQQHIGSGEITIFKEMLPANCTRLLIRLKNALTYSILLNIFIYKMHKIYACIFTNTSNHIVYNP